MCIEKKKKNHELTWQDIVTTFCMFFYSFAIVLVFHQLYNRNREW